MKNIVNIDIVENCCKGTYCSGENCNVFLLQIRVPALINPYMHFTKSDSTTYSSEILTITENIIEYESPIELFINKGELKLKLLADGYESEEIIFNVINNYNVSNDDLYVKYNEATDAFEVRKNEAGASSIIDIIYPVGSIYMSVNEVDPTNLFGGTWERIKDTFLLAAGDVYANGTTGGEATHTLTENEMPSHKHKNYVGQGDGGGTYSDNLPQSTWTNKTYWNYYETDAVGGGQPHNNMPPYLAVYVWKRTA